MRGPRPRQMLASATLLTSEHEVLDRFPSLSFVFLESGCGWLPYWLERLDEHYVHPRDATIWEKLSGPCDQAHGTDDRARPTDAPAVAVR